MKVIGGDLPHEVVGGDENDYAWMGFGGGGELFTNVSDENLIWHVAEILCVCL